MEKKVDLNVNVGLTEELKVYIEKRIRAIQDEINAHLAESDKKCKDCDWQRLTDENEGLKKKVDELEKSLRISKSGNDILIDLLAQLQKAKEERTIKCVFVDCKNNKERMCTSKDILIGAYLVEYSEKHEKVIPYCAKYSKD